MRLPIYQIDAFTSRVFAGNPAAVVPLAAWLDDARMQAIAAENNLSETAFFVPQSNGSWGLRWFTPAVEVDLCGHATLATAWLISERLDRGGQRIRFATKSGSLEVARDGDVLTLDFPARAPEPCEVPPGLARALGREPREVMKARDLLCVFDQAEDVRRLAPDMGAVARLPFFAVIATAPGGDADFVSRFFAPAKGVPEDPVTGSSHCTLIPYWARRLGKSRLTARQLSARGGELLCEDRGARVGIAGRAVLYLEGTIEV